MKKKNLQKLATFLAYGDLPKDVGFTMVKFAENVTRFAPACGTAGCAVGFAPFAGIKKRTDEDFAQYSYRALININDSPSWNWCFSAGWADPDNTPLGAAKRIQYLLDNGKVPDGFEEDISSHGNYIADYQDVEIKNSPPTIKGNSNTRRN